MQNTIIIIIIIYADQNGRRRVSEHTPYRLWLKIKNNCCSVIIGKKMILTIRFLLSEIKNE